MNNIFAKIKGHTKKRYFKVISDKTLFECIDTNSYSFVEYSTDHNLDEDSWFKIEKFSEKEYCLDFLKSNFNSIDYESLAHNQFQKIDYIFSTQENDFYFQKISNSLFISKKFISFGEVAQIDERQDRIVIRSKPDAIYLKQSDTLVFKNLTTISSIFSGIDILFKEATNEEVFEFLKLPFISLDNSYNVRSVSKPNRKQITSALKILENMPHQDHAILCDYIIDYCPELVFDLKEKNFQFLITIN